MGGRRRTRRKRAGSYEKPEAKVDVEHDSQSSTLRDYLDVLWMRKWIVLQAIIIVPVAAVLASVREPALYSASATVLVDRANLPANLEGIYDPTQLDASGQLSNQG
jgi:uncharacterized protein involved in exopolysaccharide biosynthesis